METVTVPLGNRSYDIVIGHGLLTEAGTRIRQKRVCIITDKNVAKHHLPALEKSLKEAGTEVHTLILPAGEKTKSFKCLQQVIDFVLNLSIERNFTLIAFGGGVIGDLTGFAASSILRGIDFVQIPTTLLSMVDSSVGGKTGINTAQGKNLVGAFYQPKLVLMDLNLLSTLPSREFASGYAEVVKYGLINNPNFFEWLDKNIRSIKKRNPETLIHAITESCKAKRDIVAADERESNVRALLNLGHTFGHALEAETGFSRKLLHGEGVAIGMVQAFQLSANLGLCSAADVETTKAHLKKAGLPITYPGLSPDALLHHMKKDKKVKDGKMVFILSKGIGQAFISSSVEEADVLKLLRDYA
jgi:3-dehydroquinate synthase